MTSSCSHISTPKRCDWVPLNKDFYIDYHDQEWGVPVHHDHKHFEMLTLEGAQAGLNWETILKKRNAYQQAFYQFNPEKVARMTNNELENLCKNPHLVRHRLKIFSVRQNAHAFLKIQNTFQSFDHYIWKFVEYKQITNHWKDMSEVPSSTLLSNTIAKELKKQGFTFVGTKIIYAYMQAIGMVNDHLTTCFLHPCTR